MPNILEASYVVCSELGTRLPCPESCSLPARAVPQAGPRGCQRPRRQNMIILIDPLPGQMGMELEIKVVSLLP